MIAGTKATACLTSGAFGENPATTTQRAGGTGRASPLTHVPTGAACRGASLAGEALGMLLTLPEGLKQDAAPASSKQRRLQSTEP